MNLIISEARYDLAFADVQDAFARVHSSMGANPYGNDLMGDEDLQTITNSLERLWSQRGRRSEASLSAEPSKPIETNEPTDAQPNSGLQMLPVGT